LECITKHEFVWVCRQSYVQHRVVSIIAAAAAAAAGAAAGTSQQQQSLQPPPLQLFSLCLSYAKRATAMHGIFSSWVSARFAADPARLARQIFSTCYSGRYNTADDKQLWLLLAARSLHAAGGVLSKVAAADVSNGHTAHVVEFITVAEKLRPGHTVMTLLTDCADVASWLSQQSAELTAGSSSSSSIAVKAEALQQSISQAVAKCESIRAEGTATNSSSSSEQQDVDAVTLAALLQPSAVFADMQGALQAFAAAVAAVLPTPYCCNNPGCSTLSEASELRLVRGKSSRCSKCKTSR
jgi:hypothetical protein